MNDLTTLMVSHYHCICKTCLGRPLCRDAEEHKGDSARKALTAGTHTLDTAAQRAAAVITKLLSNSREDELTDLYTILSYTEDTNFRRHK